MATAEETVPAKMLFVFADSNGKTEPTGRKLARQHVMLGKNRGKTRTAKPKRSAMNFDPDSAEGDQNWPVRLMLQRHYSTIPKKIGSEFSFTQLAAAVEPPLLHDLLRFSFIAKRVMYPLEKCVVFHENGSVDTTWIELLTCDAAYMHAAIFASQAYFASASPRDAPEATRRAIVHHSAALGLLRERLLTMPQEGTVSDSTVLVVLFLALHAHFLLDLQTAQHHMRGLRKLVDIRGGLAAFNHNTKIIIELLKCDLGIALFNGTEPVFFKDPAAEPLMPYDLAQLPADELQSCTIAVPCIDTELARVWMHLRSFCSAVNSAAVHKRQLPKETLLNAMASIKYRLLGMADFAPASVNEAVRLGCLVFSSHIFLRWQDVKPPQTHLHSTYRYCLLNLALPDALPPQVMLWLLLVGSMSIFTPADHDWLMPWLRTNMELCNAHTWSELRRELKLLLWIDFLHDKEGEAIFRTAMPLEAAPCLE